MLINNEDLTALREGSWEMACATIRLEQLGTDEPQVVEGPGRIYQGTDRRLHFSFIQPGLRKVGNDTYPKEGEPLPETEYFRLSATDMHANAWICEQVRPDSLQSHPVVSGHYYGSISRLSATASGPAVKSSRFTGRIFTPGRIKLLPNERTTTLTVGPPDGRREGWKRDVMAGRAGNYPIWLRQEENGELVVTAFGGDEFSPWFARRLLEALRFTFAMPLQWSTVNTYEPSGITCMLDDVQSQAPQSTVIAPIHPGVQYAEKHQPLVLDCYATAIARDVEPWVHPLSLEWHIVHTASARSLEMYGTALSISVEAVLKLVPSGTLTQTDSAREEQKTMKALVSRIGKELKAWKVEKHLRDRVCSHLGSINRASATHELRQLAAAGLIDAHLIDVWEWLRNPSTHGNRGALSDVRELAKACDGVLSLLYQLTFVVIGYKGHFLDTGDEGGWRYREYPRPTSGRGNQSEEPSQEQPDT